MLKRTLFFGNPAYLSHRQNQVVIQYPDGSKPETTLPVEDIGFVVLENPQITISARLLAALSENNTAVICCDEKHMPSGLMLPIAGHSEQNHKIRTQIEASLPLCKSLWQQVVTAKILNQAAVLEKYRKAFEPMHYWAQKVNSGDTQNLEGRAAAHYWPQLFSHIPFFTREAKGIAPNAWLNYGYALIRASMARALSGTGLFLTLGIHHHNKYNAFCLADDMMEPYRPWVDDLVYSMTLNNALSNDLTPDLKKQLLQLLANDICIDGITSPLMIAMQRTAASLCECFEKTARKLSLPQWKQNV